MVTSLVPLPTLLPCVFGTLLVQTNQTGLTVTAVKMLKANQLDKLFNLFYMMRDYRIQFQSVEAVVAPKRRVDLALTKQPYYSFMSMRQSKSLKQNLEHASI